MKLTSSYAVRINKIDFKIMDTINVYREAIAYCIDVFNKEWDDISKINDSKRRVNYSEKLIHSTNDNTATPYDINLVTCVS